MEAVSRGGISRPRETTTKLDMGICKGSAPVLALMLPAAPYLRPQFTRGIQLSLRLPFAGTASSCPTALAVLSPFPLVKCLLGGGAFLGQEQGFLNHSSACPSVGCLSIAPISTISYLPLSTSAKITVDTQRPLAFVIHFLTHFIR